MVFFGWAGVFNFKSFLDCQDPRARKRRLHPLPLFAFMLWLICQNIVFNMATSRERSQNSQNTISKPWILKCFYKYNIFSINLLSTIGAEFPWWKMCTDVDLHRCYSREFDILRIWHCAIPTNCWESSWGPTAVHNVILDVFKPLPLKIFWYKCYQSMYE